MKTLLPTSSIQHKLRSTSTSRWQYLCLALSGLLFYVVVSGRNCHPSGNGGAKALLDNSQCAFQPTQQQSQTTASSTSPSAILTNSRLTDVNPLVHAYPSAKTQARVGWVTMLWGNQNGGSNMVRAVKSQEKYALKHEYPFFFLKQNLFNFIWSKPAMLLSVILNERLKVESDQLEWIVWTDGDSIVMNPEIRIEDMLPPQDLRDVHMITTSDIFGLNAGAMMVRVSEYSIDILSRIIAYPGLHSEIHLDAAEQSALEKLIQNDPEVQKRVVRMPQRYFNGYRPGMLEGQNTQKGNLMMHFPGGNKEYMGKYLDEIESDSSSWSKPYDQTEYPTVIKQFWQDIKDKQNSGKPIYAPLVRN